MATFSGRKVGVGAHGVTPFLSALATAKQERDRAAQQNLENERAQQLFQLQQEQQQEVMRRNREEAELQARQAKMKENALQRRMAAAKKLNYGSPEEMDAEIRNQAAQQTAATQAENLRLGKLQEERAQQESSARLKAIEIEAIRKLRELANEEASTEFEQKLKTSKQRQIVLEFQAEQERLSGGRLSESTARQLAIASANVERARRFQLGEDMTGGDYKALVTKYYGALRSSGQGSMAKTGQPELVRPAELTPEPELTPPPRITIPQTPQETITAIEERISSTTSPDSLGRLLESVISNKDALEVEIAQGLKEQGDVNAERAAKKIVSTIEKEILDKRRENIAAEKKSKARQSRLNKALNSTLAISSSRRGPAPGRQRGIPTVSDVAR